MSAQDRTHERALADFYQQAVRPTEVEDKGPLAPRATRFLSAVGTGYVLAKVWRMIAD